MTDESIFAAALAIPDPAGRAAYLDRACAGDPALRREVEGLLAAHEAANPLDRPPADLARTGAYTPGPGEAAPSGAPGGRVGPYKLMERIGEGGMGEVWVADQVEPIRRRVAVKLIKPGMDSRQVLARFEAERQALALMEHPNIAKVLDAGATADGRPFFVMELVKGTPITEFCDARQLTPRERLGLFVPVCQAIQHAHQKGVIHRDVKPTNVLVELHDDRPVPKVIDFGVAKAVGQQLTERTLYTGFGALVGTPAYMAPEQAAFNALDVDTRADVYALGVLLYELLAGSPPFEPERLRKAALDEVLRIVRDEDPPRPSQRLSTSEARAAIAATRRSDPARLSKLMRGELDCIVMRALEKDRTRRYDTAAGLGRDVERYLLDEPVEACPPTLGYRLRRFCRRNRGPLASAAAFAAVLTLATLVSLWQAFRALDAGVEAELQRERANLERDAAVVERDQKERALAAAGRAAREKRQQLYAAGVGLARAAWERGDLPLMRTLLDGVRPGPGEEDLRGFEWHYHRRLAHAGEREVLFRYGSPVRATALGGDGVLAVAGDGESPAVRVWDIAARKEKFALSGHAGRVGALATDRDGKRLASGGADRSVRLWDLDRGEPLFSLPEQGGPVSCLAFSPDGRTLAVGTGGQPQSGGNNSYVHFLRDLRGAESQGEVKLWDLATRKPLRTFGGYGRPVTAVAFDRDGRSFAVGVADGTVRLWDLAAGADATERVLDHRSPVMAVALSPDGRTVTAGCWDAADNLCLWDAASGRRRADLRGHRAAVYAVAFSRDGATLVSAGGDQTVRVWDPATLEERNVLRGSPAPIAAAAVGRDGRSVATGDWSGAVGLWDAARRQEFDAAGGSAYALSFHPDGKVLACGRWAVELVEVDGARPAATLPGLTGPDVSVAFSQDGRSLAAGNGRGLLVVWDAKTRAVRWTRQAGREGAKNGLSAKVSGVALSPDGRTLASSSWDGRVRLWDAATGDERGNLDVGGDPFFSVAFSPDGRSLAASTLEGRAVVWDLATRTGRETPRLPGMGWTHSVAFSPDGTAIAFTPSYVENGREFGVVHLWDLAGWRDRALLRGHTAAVWCVTFSPDGKTLATASWDETVRLWNAATGRELVTLRGRAGGTGWAATFSGDGRTLATAAGLPDRGEVLLYRAGPDEGRPAPPRP